MYINELCSIGIEPTLLKIRRWTLRIARVTVFRSFAMAVCQRAQFFRFDIGSSEAEEGIWRLLAYQM